MSRNNEVLRFLGETGLRFGDQAGGDVLVLHQTAGLFEGDRLLLVPEGIAVTASSLRTFVAAFVWRVSPPGCFQALIGLAVPGIGSKKVPINAFPGSAGPVPRRLRPVSWPACGLRAGS